MTVGALLMTVSGLLITAGLLGVAAAWRGISFVPAARRSKGPAGLQLTSLHGAAVATGIVVLLMTGWPVAAVGSVAAVVFVPRVLGGATAAKKLIARSEALADWARRLSDLISSGAASSTRDALVRSLGSAPAPISEQVGRLVSRMGPQGIETALRSFAHEVSDPAAEKIAGVLILRERNGGPGLADVLAALASDLDERSRMVREVEAERAKPRANMRTIVVVTGLLVFGMVLFARTFLSAYSTALGQSFLVVVVLVFAASFRWMRRLSDPPVPAAVLIDPEERSGTVMS